MARQPQFEKGTTAGFQQAVGEVAEQFRKALGAGLDDHEIVDALLEWVGTNTDDDRTRDQAYTRVQNRRVMRAVGGV